MVACVCVRARTHAPVPLTLTLSLPASLLIANKPEMRQYTHHDT